MRDDSEKNWGLLHAGVPENWPRDDEGNPEPPVMVKHQEKGIITGLIRDMLEGYGIPAIEVDWEGGIMVRAISGVWGYGIRVFVPASRLEEANALLEAPPIWDDEEIEESAENSEKE